MGTRVVLTVALIATLAALAGCGGSSDSQNAPETETTTPAASVGTTGPSTTETTETTAPKPKPTTITIRVVGGKPQGGIARPSVKRNDRVVLVVRSDTADELHLHGYDISREVAAGGRARIAFLAKIPGRFELELEQSGVQLAELTVR